jgi:hypothetical protein
LADTNIQIEFDPKKVLDRLKDLEQSFKGLAGTIDDSLGKDAPKSIAKMEDAAEQGSNKISAMFRNLGTKVKEDLKNAFDLGSVVTGLKALNGLGEGIKQVFEMERAFDRLNTRLKLTNQQMRDFKVNVTNKVANTGQKLEDVLPGVETVAAKGGVKSPEQLADIAEQLGKSKAITGEDTNSLADTVVQILKNQGEKVTSESFKKTLDVLEGTRTSGSFKSAGEAGSAINDLTKGLTPEMQKSMGLDTRKLGALSAVASQSGEGGMDTLNKILKTGQSAGGQEKINAIFGSQIFKNGQISTEGLKGINKNNLGQFSSQSMADATGLDQAALSRFIDSFKENTKSLSDVANGANETSTQFDQATDNFSFSIDKFKENVKKAGMQIGDSFSETANDLFHGRTEKLGADGGKIASSLYENKGAVAGGLAATLGIGLLTGGGVGRLLGKVGGGGMIGGAVKGAAAKEAGIDPVYVTNAQEIGESVESENSNFGSMGGDLVSKIGGVAKGAAMVAAAGAAGYGVGLLINKIPGVARGEAAIGDTIGDAIRGPSDLSGSKQNAINAKDFNDRNGGNLTPEQYAQAVTDGTLKAYKEVLAKQHMTNPSAVQPRGH